MYTLHPGMYHKDMMIHQHLFWPSTREPVQSEIKHYESFQINKNVKKTMLKYPLS